jgi:hypothetical protein
MGYIATAVVFSFWALMAEIFFISILLKRFGFQLIWAFRITRTEL